MATEASPEIQQFASMWRMMMGQMTGAGATRAEIATFAMDISHVILDQTQQALWPPNTDVPATEAVMAGCVASATVHLTATRREIASVAQS